jgi:hypothetical protein
VAFGWLASLDWTVVAVQDWPALANKLVESTVYFVVRAQAPRFELERNNF